MYVCVCVQSLQQYQEAVKAPDHEARLESDLSTDGFYRLKIKADGHCWARSVAQLFGANGNDDFSYVRIRKALSAYEVSVCQFDIAQNCHPITVGRVHISCALRM